MKSALDNVDRVLGPLTWLIVAGLVVLLATGTPFVAEGPPPPPRAAPTEDNGGGADGARVFADNGCGSCHTLAAAGSSGSIGPNLDDAAPSIERVREVVRNGSGSMPSFGDVSDADLQALAAFVSKR